MSEELNIGTFNMEAVLDEVRLSFESENYEPILVLGKPGIGKTWAITELAQKELKIGYTEIRLNMMTEMDLIGIPMIKDGKTTFSENILLPDVARDGERGILVLDEISAAPPNMKAFALQLLDVKRSIGTYKLPPKWLVVALGNGPEDSTNYQGLDVTLLSRCTCMNLEVDVDGWKKWATANGLNPTVLAYVSFYKIEALHTMKKDHGDHLFACPRTWHKLSNKLNFLEKKNNGKPLDTNSVEDIAKGCIGNSDCARFATFYSFNSELISVEGIMNGTAPKDVSNIKSEVMYIVMQALIKEMASVIKTGLQKNNFGDITNYDKDLLKKVANACNWVISVGKFRLDFAVMALTDIAQNIPDFVTLILNADDEFDKLCPDLIAFADENSVIFGQ